MIDNQPDLTELNFNFTGEFTQRQNLLLEVVQLVEYAIK